MPKRFLEGCCGKCILGEVVRNYREPGVVCSLSLEHIVLRFTSGVCCRFQVLWQAIESQKQRKIPGFKADFPKFSEPAGWQVMTVIWALSKSVPT